MTSCSSRGVKEAEGVLVVVCPPEWPLVTHPPPPPTSSQSLIMCSCVSWRRLARRGFREYNRWDSVWPHRIPRSWSWSRSRTLCTSASRNHGSLSHSALRRMDRTAATRRFPRSLAQGCTRRCTSQSRLWCCQWAGCLGRARSLTGRTGMHSCNTQQNFHYTTCLWDHTNGRVLRQLGAFIQYNATKHSRVTAKLCWRAKRNPYETVL